MRQGSKKGLQAGAWQVSSVLESPVWREQCKSAHCMRKSGRNVKALCGDQCSIVPSVVASCMEWQWWSPLNQLGGSLVLSTLFECSLPAVKAVLLTVKPLGALNQSPLAKGRTQLSEKLQLNCFEVVGVSRLFTRGPSGESSSERCLRPRICDLLFVAQLH